MSTAKIDIIKNHLIQLREEISQIEAEETAHKGNAMSGINMALDNLGAFRAQVGKEAEAKAQAEAKKLEEARKVVAEAEAKATAAAATKAAPVAATPETVKAVGKQAIA